VINSIKQYDMPMVSYRAGYPPGIEMELSVMQKQRYISTNIQRPQHRIYVRMQNVKEDIEN
jgi:hypothetical protein